jgi:hypothetical protein
VSPPYPHWETYLHFPEGGCHPQEFGSGHNVRAPFRSAERLFNFSSLVCLGLVTSTD